MGLAASSSILVRSGSNLTSPSNQNSLNGLPPVYFQPSKSIHIVVFFHQEMKIAEWRFLNEKGSQNSQKTLY
ncbi:hypothetical protein SUGI_0048480 [Cryptomeria japonica]|nr:hypothetical protein SUGI_0048480 [Cryptomeria japonica]